MDKLFQYYDEISETFQGGCGKPTPFLVDVQTIAVKIKNKNKKVHVSYLYCLCIWNTFYLRFFLFII
jgi:hypothetical protein